MTKTKQTTVYLNDDQRNRIDSLPRGVSFSELVRDSFDIILKNYEKPPFVIKAVR